MRRHAMKRFAAALAGSAIAITGLAACGASASSAMAADHDHIHQYACGKGIEVGAIGPVTWTAEYKGINLEGMTFADPSTKPVSAELWAYVVDPGDPIEDDEATTVNLDLGASTDIDGWGRFTLMEVNERPNNDGQDGKGHGASFCFEPSQEFVDAHTAAAR